MEIFEELVEGAKEELKRADHSIYVSLKYTRTVDIIKNTIKRLISAFDITIIWALEYLKKTKKISDIPPVSRKRAQLLASSFPVLKKEIEFYNLMRDIDLATFTRKEEYRKNVALVTKINDKPLEVNVEILKKYFDRTVIFVDTVHTMLEKK